MLIAPFERDTGHTAIAAECELDQRNLELNPLQARQTVYVVNIYRRRHGPIRTESKYTCCKTTSNQRADPSTTDGCGSDISNVSKYCIIAAP